MRAQSQSEEALGFLRLDGSESGKAYVRSPLGAGGAWQVGIPMFGTPVVADPRLGGAGAGPASSSRGLEGLCDELRRSARREPRPGRVVFRRLLCLGRVCLRVLQFYLFGGSVGGLGCLAIRIINLRSN
jgi:hypothetical protein